MSGDPIISLNEGWERIHQNGIQKLIRMISNQDDNKVHISNNEYMDLYT